MTLAFRNRCTESAFAELFEGGQNELSQEFPYIPLTHPGISASGPDFDVQATNWATDVAPKDLQLAWAYYRAMYDSEFTLGVRYKASVLGVKFILGGLWGFDADGPRPADVMVVGKMPGQEEVIQGSNLYGPSGQELQRAVERTGYRDWGNWYVDNLVRHPHPDPRQGGALDNRWVKNCKPLLEMTLAIVRPRYMLLLGGEAITHVLGKGNNLTSTQGRVFEKKIPIRLPDGTDGEHVIQVMTSVHPAFVIRRPEKTESLNESVRRFVELVSGGSVNNPEADIDHRAVRKIEDLRKCRREVLSDPRYTTIAVDAEWHGEYPYEPGAYMRTVQFSWWPKKAASVVLHDTEGKYCFDAPIEEVAKELNLIMKSTPERKTRIAGHFLNADMPWLMSIGVDVLDEYYPPLDDANANGGDRLFGWQKTETEGGFDTILAAHAVTETSEFKLETLATRYTTCPRYDFHLQKWKKKFCSDNDLDNEELEGYGPCPDEVLVGKPTGREVDWGEAVDDSYGCYDADATRRLVDVYNGTPDRVGLLDDDVNHQNCRIPFWRSMWSCPAFGEMHRKGLGIDMKEADGLVALYRDCAQRLLAKIRHDTNWPKFNPNSVYDCRELLFGELYTGKFNRTTWVRESVSPPGAFLLHIPPYKSTGKRPKLWADIEKRNEGHLYSPSCDKEVLQVLADVHPIVALLRDLRVIAQTGKYVLRPRAMVTVKEDRIVGEDPLTGTPVIETEERQEEGEYERGMLSYVHVDNSIRSRFSQTKETGRASSWGPPLQNLGKSAEEKYEAIFKRYKDAKPGSAWPGLGLDYKQPLRSIIRARLKPHPVTGEMIPWLLVDADWTGAELAIMAWQSGDAKMTEHVRRASLKESNPDFYDIHSNVACNTFRLTVPDMRIETQKQAEKWKVPVGTHVCEILKKDIGDLLPATKKALALIGKAGLRTAAKAVVFGYAYGQQAEATYRKARQEGVEDITLQQAQALIEGLTEMYTALPPYFEWCRQRSQDPGFLVNCFYRMRRFVQSSDRQTRSEQERQAMNFPIQSAVADAMNMAMGYLYWYRYEVDDPSLWYDIVLQVHDAVVLECPYYCVDWVTKTVLPTCMGDRVPVYPVGLDGSPRQGGPYHLQVPPPDVFERWSVPLTRADCERLQISESYAAA
jgi:uracil-DNA glycosylase family 4